MPTLKMGGGGYTVTENGRKLGFVWQAGKNWFARVDGSVKALDLNGHKTRRKAVEALVAHLNEDTTNDH